MGRIVYFDCPSGASGDMILGALVDAGVAIEELRTELAKLPLPGWALTAREVRKGAFRATKVDVVIDREAPHPHRSLDDILAILRESALGGPIQERAARIFRRLVEAEARVHGTSPDAVQLHDVGAVDAIVDVTGSVIGLALLEAETIAVSALPLGGGMVHGPHGTIPVPAPGTLELLRGFPVVDTAVRAELVTPTGAAILTTLAGCAGPMPPMTITAVGYGAGSMDLPEMPNVLRCLVGAATGAAGMETILQMETTIDDMSPQLYEPLMERLFEAGALDVFLTPVIMKRGRPGVVLTALCAVDRVGVLSRVLFEESSTIGVRWSPWQRARLDRDLVTLATAYGPIAFKVSRLDGKIVTVTPEFLDVARVARGKGIPTREVLEAVRAEARSQLGR